MIDSLAHAATDTGIPDAGLRISIGVVATFLLAVAGLLLLLKAREADQAVNEISEKSGK